MSKSMERPEKTMFTMPPIVPLVLPEWNVYPRKDGHFSLKYLNGFLYINPREIQIGSSIGTRADRGHIYKLLLREPMSDEHISAVVEKYNIYIDFENLNYTTPMNLFFLYFMEELLGPVVEYQAPFYDFGEPRQDLGADVIDKHRKMVNDNDSFWNYLFKQINLVSRKQKLRVSKRMVPWPRKIFSQPTSEQVFSAGRRTRRTKK